MSQPVPINDREYVDGAIYSINNADLASSSSPHVVIVSAPLSGHRLHARFGPMWSLRNAMHLQTVAELRRLRSVDQVVVIEPTAADVAAMGPNLNANQRRARVANSAYSAALGILSATRATEPTIGALR